MKSALYEAVDCCLASVWGDSYLEIRCAKDRDEQERHHPLARRPEGPRAPVSSGQIFCVLAPPAPHYQVPSVRALYLPFPQSSVPDRSYPSRVN